MPEEPISVDIVRDDARGIVVRYKVFSHLLEFESRQITAWSEDESSVMFTRTGSSGDMDITEDFDQGERYISGMIKWDGCSHFYFGDDAGYLHLCGERDIDTTAWLIRQVLDYAASHVPAFDRGRGVDTWMARK